MTHDLRRWIDLLEGLAQGGTLYHATDVMSAARILLADEISAKTDHNIGGKRSKPGVSLTRSFRFAADWKREGVVFALDGDKLRSRQKLQPHDYYRDRRENEEFLLGSIKPLSRVLTAIFMEPETHEWCVEQDENMVEGYKDYEGVLAHPLLVLKTFPAMVPYYHPRKPAFAAAKPTK